MEIGDEIALSQADSLSKSDSLLLSDRNKLRDEAAGVLNAASSGSPRKRFVTMDILYANSDKVLNPTPLSQFNPNEKSASVVTVKAPVVVKGKATKPSDVDVGKVISDVVTDLENEKAPDVVTDKSNEKVPYIVKVKSTGVVTYNKKGKVPGVSKDKQAGVVNEKRKGDLTNDKPQDKVIVPAVVNEKPKCDVTKDKPQVIVPAVVNKKLKLNVKAPAVLTDKSPVVLKDKAGVKDNSSKDKPQVTTKGSILRSKDKAQVETNTKALETKAPEMKSVQAVSEGLVLSSNKPVQEEVNEKRKSKVKAPAVLTDNSPVVLKDKAGVKDKSSKDKPQVKTKAFKDKTKDMPQVETNTKASETKSVKALSEAPILRLNKPVQEEVKPKRKLVLSKVDQSKKKPYVKLQKDADDFQDTEVDHKKKNLKSKVVLKRKRDNHL